MTLRRFGPPNSGPPSNPSDREIAQNGTCKWLGWLLLGWCVIRILDPSTTTTSLKSTAIHPQFAWQYTSSLYCSAFGPPEPQGKGQYLQCSPHFCRNTFPFLLECFRQNLGGLGHQDWIPFLSKSLHSVFCYGNYFRWFLHETWQHIISGRTNIRNGPEYGFGEHGITQWVFVKVARLQSEFCTKDFFSSHEFSYEKCSEIFPEIFEPLFCGSEKIPGKFPPNFPLNFPNFPAKNQKKFTDELLQECREKSLALTKFRGEEFLGL